MRKTGIATYGPAAQKLPASVRMATATTTARPSDVATNAVNLCLNAKAGKSERGTAYKEPGRANRCAGGRPPASSDHPRRARRPTRSFDGREDALGGRLDPQSGSNHGGRERR